MLLCLFHNYKKQFILRLLNIIYIEEKQYLQINWQINLWTVL